MGTTMPSLAFSAVWTIVGTMINFGATKKKGLSPFEAKSLVHMVGVKGFEPSTPCTMQVRYQAAPHTG